MSCFVKTKSIFTSEGRIAVFEEEDDVLYKFEYKLKDHLGNTRVVFGGHTSGKVEHIQRTAYYPFGLVMDQQDYITFAGLNSKYAPFENKFLYNGKEWQNEEIGGVKLDWYDYGARFYDPQLARWHSVDPSAEWGFALSPYNYTNNNPVRYIDPDGRWFWEKKHIRKARQLRRRTKGSLHIWKKDGKKYASVSYGTKGTTRSGAGSIAQVFRPTTKSRKTQTKAGGYTITGNSFFSGGGYTGDGYRAEHNYGTFDGSYNAPLTPLYWALQWIVDKVQPLVSKEPEIGKPKITSDKEIVEKTTGNKTTTKEDKTVSWYRKDSIITKIDKQYPDTMHTWFPNSKNMKDTSVWVKWSEEGSFYYRGKK